MESYAFKLKSNEWRFRGFPDQIILDKRLNKISGLWTE